MRQTYYPYCKHGTYVGGCGADYMCGPCEMGEEDPTPRELLDRVIWEADQLAKRRAKLAESMADADPALRHDLDRWFNSEKFLDYDLQAFRAALNHFTHVSQLANGMDDRDWLNRLYDKQQAEWEAMSGEDQFWSLPADVLDGP